MGPHEERRYEPGPAPGADYLDGPDDHGRARRLAAAVPAAARAPVPGDGAAADAGAGPKVATSIVNVQASFADSKQHARQIVYRSGRAVPNADSIGMQLSDTKLECGDSYRGGGFMIHVELPHPPGAFVGPLTIGTYVNHQQEQLDERLIARPHEATLTLRAYSREPGGRISGSLELLNEGKIGGQSHR